MSKRMLFIFNPHSGKAQVKQRLYEIVDYFVKDGFEVIVHPTQEKLDAKRMVKEYANQCELIVCSGGAGTVNEVVDGLMDSEIRPVLGYIPTGTVNDFATSLKLSKNIEKATIDILEGEPFACDIGGFNREYFTYVAAFGAFTDVAYETPQQTKNMLGRMAYIFEGVKRLGNLQSYLMRVEYDQGVIEDEFIFGMVTNAKSVGGFKGLSGKGVKMNDGLFEVCLIKMPKNPIELQMIINALVTREINRDYIYSFRAAQLKLFSEDVVPWTLDGEYGGSETEVLIQNYKQAIQIIRPRKHKAKTDETALTKS